MKVEKKLKPFIKWVGGKGQLLETIRASYPQNLGSSISTYVEPFIGGGAVLFDILSNYSMKKIYISDINLELINTYKMIRNNLDKVINKLEKYQNDYVPLDTQNRKLYFYDKRSEFNNIKIGEDDKLNIKKASLFIFLNKTCFNGLYRVNKKGEFNVPIGSYKNPCILDRANLINISNTLSNIEICCCDYKNTINFIDKNTFVYIDSPYRPLTKTSSFTAYTTFGFENEQQIELGKFVATISRKNAKILISNSDPKNIDDNDNFFDEIYKYFNIERVMATRMINSKSSDRGKITELLIKNY